MASTTTATTTACPAQYGFVYKEAAQVCELPAEEWFDLVVWTVLVVLVVVLLGSAVVHTICRCCARERDGSDAQDGSPHTQPLLGEDDVRKWNARRINQGISQGFMAGVTGFQQRVKDDQTLIGKEPEELYSLLRRFPIFQRVFNKCPRFFGRVSRVIYFLFKDHLQWNVGVGLPLFYNFHALPLMAFAFAWLISPQYHRVFDGKTLVDPEAFAKDTCLALLYLYVFMLMHAWVHAKLGDVFEREFQTNTSSMSDYALLLTGLPPSTTNEGELLTELQSALPGAIGVSICYNLDDKGVASTIDEMTQYVLDIECGERNDEETQPTVLPRDSDSRAPEFQEKLKRLLDQGALVGGSRAFVVFKNKASRNMALLQRSGIFRPSEELPKTEQIERTLSRHKLDRGAEDWQQLLAPVELPSSSGGVRDLLLAGTRFRPHDEDGHSRYGQFSQGHARALKDTYECQRLLRVDKIMCEPPSVNWQSIGTRHNDQRKKLLLLKMWGILSLVFLAICVVVYYPWFKYIQRPYTEAGKSYKKSTNMFWGWISQLVNSSILGAVLWNLLGGVGLMTSNQMDISTFWYSSAVSCANNMYNLWDPYLNRSYPVHLDGWANRTSEHHWESNRSADMYAMFMPGWFFLGFLNGQVGTFLPFLVNWLILNCIFVWNIFPLWLSKILSNLVPGSPLPDEKNPKKPISKRAAEFAFDPYALSLTWDYYNIVYTPALCLLLFFFTSPDMWHICPWVCVYISMMYCWHRFVLLTTRKKAMHTSRELDRQAIIFWGVPCSMVAAACVLWAFRAGLIQQFWVVPASFVASVLLYGFGLLLIFRHEISGRSPWSVEGDTHSVSIDFLDEPYESVSKRTGYNWFNANPVHVLKSRYLPDQVPEESRERWAFDFGVREFAGLAAAGRTTMAGQARLNSWPSAGAGNSGAVTESSRPATL